MKIVENFFDWLECKLEFRRRKKEARRKRQGDINVASSRKSSNNYFTIINLK